MRRLHFLLALRQLQKNKGFTTLNILGLTLGLLTFLCITLYVVYESGYDRYNLKAGRIYRVNTDLKLNDHISYMADAAPPVAATLRVNYPEVETAIRMLPQPGTRFRKGQENIAEPHVVVCDPKIFDVFTLPMTAGDPASALQKPHTVVITESTARRYFNNIHAVGRTLDDIDDSVILTVTGVIRDLPAQSSFHYDFFISMAGNSIDRQPASFFALFPMSTFILLRPGANATAFQRQLSKFMFTWDNQYKNSDTADFSLNLNLTALTDIHLRSNRTDELEPNGNIQYVYIFSAIAVLVLLIAAINFMNLSTARSAGRSREVGVRKVLGSARHSLIAQFLSESMLMALVSTLLAFALTVLLLPFFNQLSGRSLSIDGPTLTWLIPVTLLIIVTVGLLSGAYPAFFLSAFRPIDVLKGQLLPGAKGSTFRSVLVVLQFSISLFLIIATLTIFRQLHYIQNRDLGFDRSHVLSIKGTSSLADPTTLKQEVLKLPAVENASLSGFLPTNDIRWHNFGHVQGGSSNSTEIQSWLVDADYIPTLQMRIVKGRNFSQAFATDSTAVVLNETAARAWDIAEAPIGRVIELNGYRNGQPLQVIGIVKDFNFASLRSNINPLCMVINRMDQPDQLNIRARTDDIPALLSQLKAKWSALAPHQPFECSFLDADFDAIYRSEQRMGQLSFLFAALAVLIACLGLFGLAAYAAEQRRKEVGIRKVLGANVTRIVALLSTDFLRLVAFSILIGMPLAWIGMHRWLQNFAYRATLDPLLFALAAVLVLLIALGTTLFQSLRAAATNPADILRNE